MALASTHTYENQEKTVSMLTGTCACLVPAMRIAMSYLVKQGSGHVMFKQSHMTVVLNHPQWSHASG